jgi:hypothetical protein
LVNLDDQVIGIPTLAAVDQELGGTAPGIRFALPSNTVATAPCRVNRATTPYRMAGGALAAGRALHHAMADGGV